MYTYTSQVVCDSGYIGTNRVYTCSNGIWDHISADNPTGVTDPCGSTVF